MSQAIHGCCPRVLVHLARTAILIGCLVHPLAAGARSGAGPVAGAAAIAGASVRADAKYFHPQEQSSRPVRSSCGRRRRWKLVVAVDQYRALDRAEKLRRGGAGLPGVHADPRPARRSRRSSPGATTFTTRSPCVADGSRTACATIMRTTSSVSIWCCGLPASGSTGTMRRGRGRRSASTGWLPTRTTAALRRTNIGSTPTKHCKCRLTVMVERGSHAMAPDVDGDGRFTPGVDSINALKAQWGIRDSGSDLALVPEVVHGPAGQLRHPCLRSGVGARRRSLPSLRPVPCRKSPALVPGSGFVLGESARISSGPPSWLVRTFGDVRVGEPDGPDRPAKRSGAGSDGATPLAVRNGLRRRVHHCRPRAGGGASDDAHSGSCRRGYAARTFSRKAVALLPTDRRTLFEATVWGSYRVDAITNVLIGYGWFSGERRRQPGPRHRSPHRPIQGPPVLARQ